MNARRRLLALLCAGIAGLCGISPQAAARDAGGTLVVAVPGDPGHLNPAISTASPVHAVADSIHNGLVVLDRDGNPQPDLARSWEVSPDGLTATFRLAPGVTWHDGRPFTAADVAFSFEEVLFRYHARTRAGLAPVVAEVEAPDPQTVVFRLKRPHPSLLRQLDVTEAPILPRHLYEGSDPNRNAANLRPVGTGAFRIETYRRDDSIVLVRNDAYFKAGLPRLDRLVFRVIPEANTQILALANGEVDYLGRVGPSDVRRLGSGVSLVRTTSGPGGANCIMTLAFNLQRERLADRRIREVFARAIDRGRMLDLILFGQGRVAAAPISSGIGWAHLPDALAAYTVDPAEAGRLLDAAGLGRDGDGVRASFDLVQFPQFARYAELLRQQLAPLGIELRARSMDPAAFADAVFTRRDFDLALISYCNGVDPEIGVRRMYHSSAIGNVPFSNAAAYRNAEIDRLFDRAGSEGDSGLRRALYQEIQRRVAADLPYWWLVETDFVTAHRDDFRGFAPWSGQFAEQASRVR